MRKIKWAFAAVLICSLGAAQAADGQPVEDESAWVQVARTDDYVFSVRKGSYETSKTKGGEEVAVVLGQALNIVTRDIEYRKWYVARKHCLSGLGKLVMLDTTDVYKSEVDYVNEGDSAASEIGTVLCAIYKGEIKEAEDKGL